MTESGRILIEFFVCENPMSCGVDPWDGSSHDHINSKLSQRFFDPEVLPDELVPPLSIVLSLKGLGFGVWGLAFGFRE